MSETSLSDLRNGFTQADLVQVVVEMGLETEHVARAMTRAELIRLIDGHDPRD